MKFGGTSIKTTDRIKHACHLIAASRKEKNSIAVVVSALGDMTDQLVDTCNFAQKNQSKTVQKSVETIRKIHFGIAEKSISSSRIRDKTINEVELLTNEIGRVLSGISHLGELTPRIRDYVLSFGEKLSAPIMAGALNDAGVKAIHLTGKDVGIVTDSNYGEAHPLMEMTNFQVRNKLEPLLKKSITPVITGFMAADQKGTITTLGRGGSDYTATIIASAITADEVRIWTDVSGLMTADPRIEPSAKTISTLSFREAVEMAFFGAKMMHPRALEVAMQDNIPVRVLNTFESKNPGTLITENQEIHSESVVKAISLIPKIALITVSGAGMVGAPGTAAKLFEVLGRNNVNILMISQGSSEATISFAIPRPSLDVALNAVEMSLLGTGIIREITSEDDVSIVALVGAGMKGTPGVAARIFSAVAKKHINVRMIAQGSSELNVSFVVKENDGPEAVRMLHDEFKLGQI